MTSAPEPRPAPRTAAEWFALRRAPHDASFERAFQSWLAESPEHREEYALCEVTWELSAEATRGMSVGEATPAPRVRRRGLLTAAAALVAVPVLALLVLRDGGEATTVWRTAPGEQRSIALADGSRVMLNTRTELEVEFERDRRLLRLKSGEAFFEVAKDPSRPFVVETSFGSARAVGTRFNVLLSEARLDVDTEEGRVLVSARDATDASGVLAVAGTRATLEAGAVRATLSRSDLARVQNWRAQRLEFDGAPLREVLREFSRYTQLPVRADSAQIGDVRVSAVLRPGDIEALRATLSGAFGLTLVARQDAWIVTAAETPARTR